jgi:polysaccharide export outer membrane protein
MRLLLLAGLLLAPWGLLAGVAPPVLADAAGYRLNPGDLVRISVWREEQLDREALVQPDGLLSFPLAGSVPAAGRSVTEVQEAIAARLERFLPDALVTVELLEARGNLVYVLGEVNRPGAYQLGSEISVVKAISLAGGLTPFATKSDIRVVRKTAGGEVDFTVDFGQIESGRDLAADIPLLAGDTVIVPGGSLF